MIKAILISMALPCSLVIRAQSSLNVYFEFNRHQLSPAARIQLDSFLAAEKENISGHIINLDGFCDARGSDQYNNTLSVKRVSAVKNYLLKKGIEKSTIGNTRGHGEKEPLNENKTEEERQMNRRVAIRFIEVARPDFPGEESLMKKLADTNAVAGTNIILRNINFVGGRHQFLPQSEPILNELLNAMRQFPGLIIRVEGHICCQDEMDDGIDNETGIENLSEARAKAVMDYLLSNGIESNRITFKGFGHSAPVYPYPEQTEEERIQNRRVEIKIIKK